MIQISKTRNLSCYQCGSRKPSVSFNAHYTHYVLCQECLELFKLAINHIDEFYDKSNTITVTHNSIDFGGDDNDK